VLSQPDAVPKALIGLLLTLPERHAARVIAALGLLFALAYSASLIVIPKPSGRILLGDALHHYVQLRSAVFDGDLHFRNEYVRMYGLRGGEPGTAWVFEDTDTGHVRNLMPVGPALLWAPLFLLVTAGAALGNLVGLPWPLDGYARVYQATAGWSGIAAATAGAWLSCRASALLFSRRAAAWSVIVLWLSSSALYYSVISPTYSHAASLLATSGFWYAWVRTNGAGGLQRSALLGGLAGFSALMRWQDVILFAPIAVDLLWAVRRYGLSPRRAVAGGLVSLAVGAAVFAPQMIVWMVLYGRPLALPQGAGFMRWTEPALLQVLFSDWHGLLTWTPVCAIAMAGLVLLARRDPRTGAAATLFLVLSWYVNAAVADWWAGEAFGSRRFVSCFPVFALGLAALIDRWKPAPGRLALASSVIVGHTFLLLVQYQAFMHGLREVAPYPRGAYNLWLARFVVPFDLARDWFAP
jgi:hypothetical protein